MDRTVIDAGKALVRSRDLARSAIVRHPDSNTIEAYFRGQEAALDLGLAALAGLAGFRTRESFEVAINLDAAYDASGKAATGALPDDSPMGGWEPRA